MYNEGLITKIDGDFASVKIVREGACGHDCSTCGGCSDGTTEIIAKNKINASVGDFVSLEGDGIIVRRAFLVYMMPIICFFAGYGIGYAAGLKEGLSALVGLILCGIDIALTVVYSKKQKEKGKVPVITKVL